MTALIPEAAERALILWDRYNEQKGNREQLESGPATQAQCQASFERADSRRSRLCTRNTTLSFGPVAIFLSRGCRPRSA
jgi:hypothetical protein